MDAPPGPAPAQIRDILAHLDASFVARDRELRLLLLTLLAGHHALILGPPGTGKSLLARAICSAFGRDDATEARYFDYLLTRFTHPDELFGPISIPGLKDEDYRRLTEGHLPDAEIAFLDEVFKANSAILNSLLGLLNERLFHCGRRRLPVPLIGLIAASNEPPDPDAGLAALYDRFLVRLTVAPVDRPDHFLAIALGDLPPCAIPHALRFTPTALATLRDAARAITVPPGIRAALVTLRDHLRDAPVSDRRWRAAVDLLRMAALTSGRTAIAAVDLALLAPVLGDPADPGAARHALRRALETVLTPPRLRELAAEWGDLDAPSEPDVRARRQARVDKLDTFARAVQHALAELDTTHHDLIADLSASPWLSTPAGPDPDLLTRLLAALATSRAKLESLADLAARHREELTTLALHGELLARLRRAQAQAGDVRGREDQVVVWLASPGDEPDSWVPVSADGWLLFDAAPRIAGRIQRRLVDETLASGRSFDATPPWHEAVTTLPLDDDTISALLSSWFELQTHLLARGFAPGSPTAAALRALSEWLRAAGVPRLPHPPELPPELVADLARAPT